MKKTIHTSIFWLFRLSVLSLFMIALFVTGLFVTGLLVGGHFGDRLVMIGDFIFQHTACLAFFSIGFGLLLKKWND